MLRRVGVVEPKAKHAGALTAWPVPNPRSAPSIVIARIARSVVGSTPKDSIPGLRPVSDASQELPLLRRLAVALWESRRSGNQETVTRLLAEWCDLTGWGGKGGVSLVVDSVVDSEVDGVVDGQGSVKNTRTLGMDRGNGRVKNGARHTWLSPYLSAFRSAYGENQIGQGIGRMARVFGVLEKAYP